MEEIDHPLGYLLYETELWMEGSACVSSMRVIGYRFILNDQLTATPIPEEIGQDLFFKRRERNDYKT